MGGASQQLPPLAKPPPAVDYTDTLVQELKKKQRDMQMRQGLAGTFLTGASVSGMPVLPRPTKTLLGGGP